MTLPAPAARDLAFVETSLNFADPDFENPLLDETDRSKSLRKHDPSSAPDAAYRQSFEVRTIAIMP